MLSNAADREGSISISALGTKLNLSASETESHRRPVCRCTFNIFGYEKFLPGKHAVQMDGLVHEAPCKAFMCPVDVSLQQRLYDEMPSQKDCNELAVNILPPPAGMMPACHAQPILYSFCFVPL